MSELAIQIEDLSKMYRLGQVGTGTLAHDLNRWWARVRGKPDPYRRIGAVNRRDEAGGEYVWALRGVSLEVEQGQVLGIIGKNGAGKSTLLKLLSRVTAPTEGRIRARGRLASLLEVGTGFHPELTGRENIFLNGAILGMTRPEIRSQFDDIVDFSGCAKYIDTPVKRYSSGMYVRLAFAVAAHLQPDILIVDEVLAVGDADFQARCIGKMSEVSRQHGRTILFVSHNMGAVRQLCPTSVLLSDGEISMRDETRAVIAAYLKGASSGGRFLHADGDEKATSSEVLLREAVVLDADGHVDTMLASATDLTVVVSYTLLQPVRNLRVALTVNTLDGTEVFTTSDFLADPAHQREAGHYTSRCVIPGDLLNVGTYVVAIDFDVPCERGILLGNSVEFTVDELSTNQLGRTIAPHPSGVIHPKLDWSVHRHSEPWSAIS